MLNLFKKKDVARPIFAPLGTDMHCHLIPKVDDGSKCMEESIECLETLHAVGYKKVIITPHFQHPRFPNDEEDIKRRYEELKKQAAEQGLEIELPISQTDRNTRALIRSAMRNCLSSTPAGRGCFGKPVPTFCCLKPSLPCTKPCSRPGSPKK